jgi:hypothetical protein
VPALIRAPKSSSTSSTTSRRLTRLRAESTATAACKRAPNALPATCRGSSARLISPQPGHRTRCARCSTTTVEMTGSSLPGGAAARPQARTPQAQTPSRSHNAPASARGPPQLRLRATTHGRDPRARTGRPVSAPRSPCPSDGRARPYACQADQHSAAGNCYARSARAGVPSPRSAHPAQRPPQSAARLAHKAARSAQKAPAAPKPQHPGPAHRPPPLNTLHTNKFDAPRPCPPPTERVPKSAVLQAVYMKATTGVEPV